MTQMLNVSSFARTAFTNPDGTLTRDAQRLLQTVQGIIGGTLGVIFANTVTNVPSGGIASTDVQAAINELDFEKQTKDATLTGFAALTVSANKVPYGTGADAFGLLDLDTDGTLAANSDTRLPTQKAVKTYADGLIAAADAMVFKGVIDCSANPNYPAADRGFTYRVSVAGKIGGGAGVNVEVGDILLCMVDGSASGNQGAVGANWAVIQTNIDGAVVGPASAVSGNAASFNGASGKLIQDSGKALPAGVIVGTTDTQALTNKTLTSGGVALASGSIGYAAGNGGTITQATSKSTGVTLNKLAGEITLDAAALAAGAVVSFVLTNSAIEATDLLVRNHVAGGTLGVYGIEAACASGSATVYVRNNTAGSLSEAIVIRFAVVKGATT